MDTTEDKDDGGLPYYTTRAEDRYLHPPAGHVPLPAHKRWADDEEPDREVRQNRGVVSEDERAQRRVEEVQQLTPQEMINHHKMWEASVERDKLIAAAIQLPSDGLKPAPEVEREEKMPDGSIVRHGFAQFTQMNIDYPLDQEDRSTQQMVWDRLPLSEKQKRELYLELLKEDNEARRSAEQAAQQGDGGTGHEGVAAAS